jgi:diaminopimelate decarboxylase
VIGAAVDYVTTVVDVKRTLNNTFVLLDGSRIHVDPLMKKSQYAYHIEEETAETEESVKQILCGFTCMEGDRFFSVERSPIELGSKVVFEKVGAYTMGMSPQFIELYPAVYAMEKGELTLARPKNTAKHFVG